MKLYHGTSSDNVPKIMEEGLIPALNKFHKPINGEDNGVASIYLTPYKEIAKAYGDSVLETELEVGFPRVFASEPVVSTEITGGNKFVRITVDIWSDEPTPKESEFYIRCFERIPPEKLRVI